MLATLSGYFNRYRGKNASYLRCGEVVPGAVLHFAATRQRVIAGGSWLLA